MRSFEHRCPNPECRTVLSIPEHMRGTTVVCAECGQSFFVPFLLTDLRKPPQPPQAPPRFRKAG